MAFQQNLLSFTYTPTANLRCVIHGANVGTGAVLILPAAQRAAVMFHNPGQQPICLFKGVNSLGQPQILSFGAGGTLLLSINSTWEVNPSGPESWWAISNAVGATLTVLEF